jgi:hypothetical protein
VDADAPPGDSGPLVQLLLRLLEHGGRAQGPAGRRKKNAAGLVDPAARAEGSVNSRGG